MTDPRAALVYVHPDQVRHGFMFSVCRALMHEIATEQMPFHLMGMSSGAGQLVESRNDTVAHFLDDTTCEWFWSVDTDMGFEPDTLSRLVGAADPETRPMVGALCFGLRKGEDDWDLQAYQGQCFPTLYHWEEHDDKVGFRTMVNYPENALVEVGATGAACFVVHRSVLEAIRDRYGDVWFERIRHPKGAHFSEDLSFCVRVAGVDKPIFVHTGVKTSHDKGGVFLREQEFRDQELLAGIRRGLLTVTEVEQRAS